MADKGEAIQLRTAQGIVIDQVFYNHDNSWPHISDGEAISLKADDLDNHFGENWKVVELNMLVNSENKVAGDSDLRFYPNPTTGQTTLTLSSKHTYTAFYIANQQGQIVRKGKINPGETSIFFDFKNLSKGLYNIVLKNNNNQKTVKVTVI